MTADVANLPGSGVDTKDERAALALKNLFYLAT
jgi:hypothetical protein